MCGICGVFRVDGGREPPLDAAELRRMTDVIRHRGPDDEGLVIEDGAALGARRLSIVDVAGGHQPLANERGRIWAAQNGELYNHLELRQRLVRDGHVLRTRCDTEVLPHLYEDLGPGLCGELRGKFGLAVWDADARRGVIARDRLGVKPLYYARAGDLVVFGSELKSVIASGLVSDELDPEAIAAYLTLGFVPAPLTPLRHVRKLFPGELLTVGDGGVRRERYWRYPPPQPGAVARSDDEWASQVLDGLDESVRLRLMSDVPLGAMLSGGLDSSLIVALMARHMGEPVKTFAVGFGGTDSELGDARRVAEHLGADHHELELSLDSRDSELEAVCWQMDEPLADLSSLGFLALSRLASEHVTVALSGQGADELFGGYRKHRVAALAGGWERLPRALRAPVVAAGRRAPGRGRRLADALAASDPVTRLLASAGLVHPDLQSELFSGALAAYAGSARNVVSSRLEGVNGASPLEAALYLDGQLGLADDMLHYFDRASMACSLEVRVPFLDHTLVEACARIPGSAKVRRLRGKHVLRLAARGLVPDFVLTKRKRGFFNEAVGTWLAARDGELVDRLLLDPEARYVAVLDRAAVERIVREWRGGAGHGQLVLALIMLELWLRSYLPRAFATSGPESLVLA